MTGKVFTEGMLLLERAYRGFTVTDDDVAMELWREYFEEYADDVFTMAVREFIAESDYPPTISRLRRAAEEIAAMVAGDAARYTDAKAWDMAVNDYLKAGSRAGRVRMLKSWRQEQPAMYGTVKEHIGLSDERVAAYMQELSRGREDARENFKRTYAAQVKILRRKKTIGGTIRVLPDA